jgi:hypothetical protein
MVSGLILMLVTIGMTGAGIRYIWKAFASGKIGSVLMTYLITSMLGVPMMMAALGAWSGLSVATASPAGTLAFMCVSPILVLMLWAVTWLPFGGAGVVGGLVLSLLCPKRTLSVVGCGKHGIPEGAFATDGIGLRRTLSIMQFETGYLCLLTFMSAMFWVALTHCCK